MFTVCRMLLVLKVVLGSQQCFEGYFSEKNGQCIKCPEHCLFCDSDKHCLSCANGYWGTVCELPCSKCKEGTSCEKTNGFCLERCKDGFTGLLCDALCNEKCFTCDRVDGSQCEVCSPKLQCISCEKPCPRFCMNGTCNDTGYCTLGCENGYWGHICNKICPRLCKGKSCYRENGTCVYNCDKNETGGSCNSPANDKECEGSWTNDTNIDKRREKGEENNKGIPTGHEGLWNLPTGIAIISSAVVVGFACVLVAVYLCRRIYCRQKAIHSKIKRRDNSSPVEELQKLQVPESPEGSLESKYVSGYSGEKTYIFCKDLADKPVEAFWELVWQENCGLILELSSDLKEREIHRFCIDIKNKTQTYDTVKVTYVGYNDCSSYIARKFELEKVTERKQVTHMQFLHWPRDGFPENIPKLLEFCQMLRKLRTEQTGPLLVHCSCGQRRSYTYIALDSVMDALESVDRVVVSVDQYLNQVQSDELTLSKKEYEFLRRTTEFWIVSRAAQTKHSFETRYFQDKEREVSARGVCTPHLSEGRTVFSDYFLMSGFSKGKKYIVCKDPTNEPTRNGAAFWEMVWQQNCYVIVILRTMTEMKREKLFSYWPEDKKTETFDFISVRTTRVQTTNCFIHRTLEVKKLNDMRQVMHMQFPHWPPDGFPSNKLELIDFRQNVQEVSKDLSGPLLVHCSDGKSRSGLFTALDMVLSDLERKDHVDTPMDQYLEQLGSAHLISSDNQTEFLNTTIELWKSSKGKQTTAVRHAAQNYSSDYLDFSVQCHKEMT